MNVREFCTGAVAVELQALFHRYRVALVREVQAVASLRELEAIVYVNAIGG